MYKLIGLSILGITALSGCTALDAIKEYNSNLEQDAIAITYPTKAEYDAIRKRAKTESVPDPHSSNSWLLVKTDEKNGKKIYVDTRMVYTKKNTAAADVKILNPDQSYQIDDYRFFCYQGYGRVRYRSNYTADHKKKFQFLLGTVEDSDRFAHKSEEPIAKTICALGGFYQGSTQDS